MCPCNSAHIQNHIFVTSFWLRDERLLKESRYQITGALKFWRNFGTKCGTPRTSLFLFFLSYFFHLCHNNFVSIIFPYFFSFIPGTIILFLPAIIGGFAIFRNFSIFFFVIAIITITFFYIFTVLFFFVTVTCY